MSGRPLAYAPDQVKNILPGEARAPGGARTHGLPASLGESRSAEANSLRQGNRPPKEDPQASSSPAPAGSSGLQLAPAGSSRLQSAPASGWSLLL